MRLAEATRDGEGLNLCFVDGNLCVRKKAVPSGLAIAVGMKPKHALVMAAVRRMREAVADFAYMKYGDKWREHCDGRLWNGEISEEEHKILDEAINGR